MESNWIAFNDSRRPVDEHVLVQLKLSNGNEPIDKAGVFTWEKAGRGVIYPHIISYRLATIEEYNEYQERKAKFRAESKRNEEVLD